MDIVSGFNHQKPGDNKKPLIFNEGENTYVLNRTAGPDGKALYYGIGRFGSYVEYSNDGVKTELFPAIIITGFYNNIGQSLQRLTIYNDSDYDIDLTSDMVDVEYVANDLYSCQMCVLKYFGADNYQLVAFDVVDEHLVTMTFKCSGVIPAGEAIECVFVDEFQYDLSSIRV